MVAKDNDSFLNLIWRHFQVFLQKIDLSVDLFIKNELFNHAGAAAFFSFCRFRRSFFYCLSPLTVICLLAPKLQLFYSNL